MIAQNHGELGHAELLRRFPAQMTVDDLTVAPRQHWVREAIFGNGCDHFVDDDVVFSGASIIGDEFLDREIVNLHFRFALLQHTPTRLRLAITRVFSNSEFIGNGFHPKIRMLPFLSAADHFPVCVDQHGLGGFSSPLPVFLTQHGLAPVFVNHPARPGARDFSSAACIRVTD